MPNYEYASREKIDSKLVKMVVFKTILDEGINNGLTGYSKRIYELTDAKPQNILQDENGFLHFIVLDITLKFY